MAREGACETGTLGLSTPRSFKGAATNHALHLMPSATNATIKTSASAHSSASRGHRHMGGHVGGLRRRHVNVDGPVREESWISGASARLHDDVDALDFIDENMADGEFRSGYRCVVAGVSFLIDEEDPLSARRRQGYRLLRSARFDTLIGVVIVFNSILIGVELSLRIREQQAAFIQYLEFMFLCIYFLELSFRFFVMRLKCLQDMWVVFDCFLVGTGLLTMLVLDRLPSDESSISSLNILMVFRTFRLLRLARIVRLLVKFRDLWTLVQGLLTSVSTMVYTLVLLFIMVYIFACAAVELITLNKNLVVDSVGEEIVDQYFSSLPIIMLTLVQFVCMDSAASLYKPLIERDATVGLYFLAVILVISIVLMNLITAVIVNSALERANADKELIESFENEKKNRLVEKVRRIFERLDDDQSGMVTADELQQITEDDKRVLTHEMDISNLEEIFHMVDVDESGELDVEEFCDGIWQVIVARAPKAIDVMRVEKQVTLVRKQLREVQDLLISHCGGDGGGAAPRATRKSGRSTATSVASKSSRAKPSGPRVRIASEEDPVDDESPPRLPIPVPGAGGTGGSAGETCRGASGTEVPMLAQAEAPMPPWVAQFCDTLRDELQRAVGTGFRVALEDLGTGEGTSGGFPACKDPSPKPFRASPGSSRKVAESPREAGELASAQAGGRDGARGPSVPALARPCKPSPRAEELGEPSDTSHLGGSRSLCL